MILYPNCKINIGLDVLERRADGFHEVQTVMFPVRGLCDVLEMIPAENEGVEFSSGGITVDCPAGKNLCVKVYNRIAARRKLGGVKMHLHKTVPFGAGLGGGSADAAYTAMGLNELQKLGFSKTELRLLMGEMGSDTAFFIDNAPQLATGRGEILSPVDINLTGKHLIIVKPPVNVSTAEAYGGITPFRPQIPLAERIGSDISLWKDNITNAFESHIFAAHPEIGAVKERLYSLGAEYASMSGSGSAVFGIFGCQPRIDPRTFPGMFVYEEVIF